MPNLAEEDVLLHLSAVATLSLLVVGHLLTDGLALDGKAITHVLLLKGKRTIKIRNILILKLRLPFNKFGPKKYKGIYMRI